jgi:hypothetical protein
MSALLELAIEGISEQVQHGRSPFGSIVSGVVQRARQPRPISALPASPPSRSRLSPGRTFGDIAALNEALDNPRFVEEWEATGEPLDVTLSGTLYPYEPICAGSAEMWREYWNDMDRILRERLTVRQGAPPLSRRDKLRDWFTQSLFLWGFSMAQPAAPEQPRWLGLGSMDEINAVPVAFSPAAWEGLGATLFTQSGCAWDVRLNGRLQPRTGQAETGKLGGLFRLLSRSYIVSVAAPEDVVVVARSVYFSAYVWALFETPQGDAYGVWEHANIADSDLFAEGVARLARKVGELRGADDRVSAVVGPEVAAAL